MKILLSGDYHLRSVDNSGVVINGINSRLIDRLDTLTRIVNLGIEQKVDMFLILGDLFDKINPSEKLRKLFVQTVIVPLIKAKIPIMILMGNHDTNYDVVSFETEAMLAGALSDNAITFITKPEFIDFGDFTALFLPYGFTPPKNDQKAKFCFAHHGISGAETGVGVVYRAGEETSIEDFKEYPFTFSGHYHKPQGLSGTTGNVFIYVGSSNRWDWGERLDEKRVLILDTDDSTHADWGIPDRPFKQFNIVEGSTYEITEDIKDCLVKVVFTGSKQYLSTLNFPAIKRSYETLKPQKVTLHKVATSTEDSKNALGIIDTDSDEDIIKKYAVKEKLTAEQLQLGLTIFKSV